MSETIVQRNIGNVGIRVYAEPDYDGGYEIASDFLGRYAAKPASNGYSYDRATGAILCPDGILRDAKGRFVAPVEWHDWRTCQWIVDACNWSSEGYKLAYMIQDARRLEAFENGDWCMLTVYAKVTFAGKEIGFDALHGVESDSDGYVEEVAKDVLHEALADARRFLSKVCAA